MKGLRKARLTLMMAFNWVAWPEQNGNRQRKRTEPVGQEVAQPKTGLRKNVGGRRGGAERGGGGEGREIQQLTC